MVLEEKKAPRKDAYPVGESSVKEVLKVAAPLNSEIYSKMAKATPSPQLPLSASVPAGRSWLGMNLLPTDQASVSITAGAYGQPWLNFHPDGGLEQS